MSANLEAKKVVVEEIKEKINASKSVVLATYDKLTVLEVTDLRNKFKNVSSEYKVYKNTLVRKAFDELGVNDFDNDLNGTTAVVFCPEETRGNSFERGIDRKNVGLPASAHRKSRVCIKQHRAEKRTGLKKFGGTKKWTFRNSLKK